MRGILISLLLLLVSPIVTATESLKLFNEDSLNKIENNYKGQSFILLLWSIDCPPCLKEFANIQRVEQINNKPLNIIYVATDGIEHSSDITRIVKDFELDYRNHWVFDDVMPDRLRYAIDSNWYGELPRSYFYDPSHNRIAHSGILSVQDLQQWDKKQ